MQVTGTDILDLITGYGLQLSGNVTPTLKFAIVIDGADVIFAGAKSNERTGGNVIDNTGDITPTLN